MADPAGADSAEVRSLPEAAARLLNAYLTDLEDLGGRAFADPGFLVASLADYARHKGDRGLLATARGFVDRGFGMKALPSFAGEPAGHRRPVRFFVDDRHPRAGDPGGRGHHAVHRRLVARTGGARRSRRPSSRAPATRTAGTRAWRRRSGRAYVVATDPTFLRAHQTIMAKLDARVGAMSGMLGRQPGLEDETMATFYYALALDSMVKV